MPIITEAQLRDRVRQPQTGMTLTLPKGTMFSPAAADFVKQWRIEVVYDDTASMPETRPAENQPGWKKTSVFPVNFQGEMPHCITCGTPLDKKPEHMTQLNLTTYAPKNHNRIRLRGQIDKLQAMCLLISGLAREDNLSWLVDLLETLAAYCREMMSAEYNQRVVANLTIDGRNEEQLRKISHNPQEVLNLPHLTPSTNDPLILLWLNYLRCQVREAEIVTIETFGSSEDSDTYGLVRAMNLMSSAVYYVELLMKQKSH